MESIRKGWVSPWGSLSSGRGNSSERWVRLGHVSNMSDGEGWRTVCQVSLGVYKCKERRVDPWIWINFETSDVGYGRSSQGVTVRRRKEGSSDERRENMRGEA